MRNLDATLIEDSIASTAVCAECIARITSLPLSRLNDALAGLIGALRVASTLSACAVCSRQQVVHRCVAADDTREPDAEVKEV